ncbi:hypothetical protein ZWY2020_037472 [Hordeum vulgare]|nr:hypothetical protein ZWY2020_037472 [Hordeum vulgare]
MNGTDCSAGIRSADKSNERFVQRGPSCSVNLLPPSSSFEPQSPPISRRRRRCSRSTAVPSAPLPFPSPTTLFRRKAGYRATWVHIIERELAAAVTHRLRHIQGGEELALALPARAQASRLEFPINS